MWSGLGSQFKKYFCFGEFQLANPYFEGKIKLWWDEICLDETLNMLSFQQNLKALNSNIKKWNKEEFGKIFCEKRLLEICLHEIQTKGINEGYSQALIEEERLVEAQLEEQEKHEEHMWWKKSQIKWLLEGEKNTKFFHNSVIHNRFHNKIYSIKTAPGVKVEAREEIEDILNAQLTKSLGGN